MTDRFKDNDIRPSSTNDLFPPSTDDTEEVEDSVVNFSLGPGGPTSKTDDPPPALAPRTEMRTDIRARTGNPDSGGLTIAALGDDQAQLLGKSAGKQTKDIVPRDGTSVTGSTKVPEPPTRSEADVQSRREALRLSLSDKLPPRTEASIIAGQTKLKSELAETLAGERPVFARKYGKVLDEGGGEFRPTPARIIGRTVPPAEPSVAPPGKGKPLDTSLAAGNGVRDAVSSTKRVDAPAPVVIVPERTAPIFTASKKEESGNVGSPAGPERDGGLAGKFVGDSANLNGPKGITSPGDNNGPTLVKIGDLANPPADTRRIIEPALALPPEQMERERERRDVIDGPVIGDPSKQVGGKVVLGGEILAQDAGGGASIHAGNPGGDSGKVAGADGKDKTLTPLTNVVAAGDVSAPVVQPKAPVVSVGRDFDWVPPDGADEPARLLKDKNPLTQGPKTVVSIGAEGDALPMVPGTGRRNVPLLSPEDKGKTPVPGREIKPEGAVAPKKEGAPGRTSGNERIVPGRYTVDIIVRSPLGTPRTPGRSEIYVAKGNANHGPKIESPLAGPRRAADTGAKLTEIGLRHTDGKFKPEGQTTVRTSKEYVVRVEPVGQKLVNRAGEFLGAGAKGPRTEVGGVRIPQGVKDGVGPRVPVSGKDKDVVAVPRPSGRKAHELAPTGHKGERSMEGQTTGRYDRRPKAEPAARTDFTPIKTTGNDRGTRIILDGLSGAMGPRKPEAGRVTETRNTRTDVARPIEILRNLDGKPVKPDGKAAVREFVMKPFEAPRTQTGGERGVQKEDIRGRSTDGIIRPGTFTVRPADGRTTRADSAGRTIEARPPRVDSAGRPIEAKPLRVDSAGRPIEAKSPRVDSTGRPIESKIRIEVSAKPTERPVRPSDIKGRTGDNTIRPGVFTVKPFDGKSTRIQPDTAARPFDRITRPAIDAITRTTQPVARMLDGIKPARTADATPGGRKADFHIRIPETKATRPGDPVQPIGRQQDTRIARPLNVRILPGEAITRSVDTIRGARREPAPKASEFTIKMDRAPQAVRPTEAEARGTKSVRPNEAEARSGKGRNLDGRASKIVRHGMVDARSSKVVFPQDLDSRTGRTARAQEADARTGRAVRSQITDGRGGKVVDGRSGSRVIQVVEGKVVRIDKSVHAQDAQVKSNAPFRVVDGKVVRTTDGGRIARDGKTASATYTVRLSDGRAIRPNDVRNDGVRMVEGKVVRSLEGKVVRAPEGIAQQTGRAHDKTGRVQEQTGRIQEQGRKGIAALRILENAWRTVGQKFDGSAAKDGRAGAGAQRVLDGGIAGRNFDGKAVKDGRAGMGNQRVLDGMAIKDGAGRGQDGVKLAGGRTIRWNDESVRAGDPAIRIIDGKVVRNGDAGKSQGIPALRILPESASKTEAKADASARAPRATGDERAIRIDGTRVVRESRNQSDRTINESTMVRELLDQVRSREMAAHIREMVLNAQFKNGLQSDTKADNKAFPDNGMAGIDATGKLLDIYGNPINLDFSEPYSRSLDFELPGLGSINLGQIIGLGDKKDKEKDKEKDNEKEQKEKDQKKDAHNRNALLQQRRTKYIVAQGDTLESIALKQLGDERYLTLIITINRSTLSYINKDGHKVPIIYEGQVLWLPTPNELEVHRKHFFGSGKKELSQKRSISSSPGVNTPALEPDKYASLQFEKTVISCGNFGKPVPTQPEYFANMIDRTVVAAMLDEQPEEDPEVQLPEVSISRGSTSSPIGQVLDRLRYAGNRKEVNLNDLSFEPRQVCHRQCYQVRNGDSMTSIAAVTEPMNDGRLWKLLARINGFAINEIDTGKQLNQLQEGQFLVLPTADEVKEFKLLTRLETAASNTNTLDTLDTHQKFFAPEDDKNMGGPASGGTSGKRRTVPPTILERSVASPPISAPPQLSGLRTPQLGPSLLNMAIGGRMTVHKLSANCRMMVKDTQDIDHAFTMQVQARYNDQWVTIASYDHRNGKTLRQVLDISGEAQSMLLELPADVVKEMAREDFIRNWNRYLTAFANVALAASNNL